MSSESASGSASPLLADLPQGHGELILVVDDDPMVRAVATSLLVRGGYRVIAGENGAEGIALYVQRRTEVVLVITDMVMPVIDGPTMIATLLKIDPDLRDRVIVASGSNTNNDRTQFTALGIKYFLPKPYSAVDLLRLVPVVMSTAAQPVGSERESD